MEIRFHIHVLRNVHIMLDAQKMAHGVPKHQNVTQVRAYGSMSF